MQHQLEDAGQRLWRLRKEAVEAAKEAYAYVFGDANSYTHEAMRAVIALDRELGNFRLVPKRESKDAA
jgi:hypothetical protein